MRRSGILLHPTSLPGAGPVGTLGSAAHGFIDFLHTAGQSVWQVLPIGPTHDDGSPYQCLSVFAGNARLICLSQLVEEGWLPAHLVCKDADATAPENASAWAWLGARLCCGTGDPAGDALVRFQRENRDWLEDHALFVALRESLGRRPWTDWPKPLRDRDPEALVAARRAHKETIERVRLQQFVFHRQWEALRRHARARGVLLFGDLPIFVAHDSADVWAERRLFRLDADGRPEVVAGVPPDYFSATGQLWGNPHYRWDVMAAEGHGWWVRRLAAELARFDFVRIDHFRGFEAFWEVPADHDDAIGGRWVPGPGNGLFDRLLDRFGRLPIVAEDLGLITPEVLALRDRYGLPGMKVLQFAFDGSPDNPYLPHRHTAHAVVYTGTHDNDTTCGWFESLDPATRVYVDEYLGYPGEPMPWSLIRCAMASSAALSIVPMQDVLGLDGRHRMNTPGTIDPANWAWRLESREMLSAELADRLARLARLYGRVPV